MDALAAVSAPALRETLLFARGQAAPVTAGDVAAGLGIHRNAARSRLDRLAGAGLLEVDFERRTGKTGPGAGRPAKIYRVAPESAALEVPARRYPALFARIVDELPRRGRDRALRRAGEDFGRELAEAAGIEPVGDPATGLEQVCAAVRALGFQASLVSVEDDVAVVATPTCPLRPLVIERPEVAELDRGMWAGLVERALQGVRADDVRCETHSCLDGHASCSVVIRLSLRAAATAR